jgi:tetratricopeptide (TPR) repeat protein
LTKIAEQFQASPDASLFCKSTKADAVSAKTGYLVAKKSAVSWIIFLVLSACATDRPFPQGQAAFDLGVMLFDQGKFQEAIPYFQRATGENPKLAQAYLYLGRSQLSIRRWRDAIQPLRTAYRLAPQETKEEVFNILVDALVAASLDVPGQAPTPRASP